MAVAVGGATGKRQGGQQRQVIRVFHNVLFFLIEWLCTRRRHQGASSNTCTGSARCACRARLVEFCRLSWSAGWPGAFEQHGKGAGQVADGPITVPEATPVLRRGCRRWSGASPSPCCALVLTNRNVERVRDGGRRQGDIRVGNGHRRRAWRQTDVGKRQVHADRIWLLANIKGSARLSDVICSGIELGDVFRR